MLGVQLFERTKRGTFATENGKAFLTVAERIVTDIDNLLTTAKNVSYGEQGRLAIGFSSSLMTGNLRFAIGDYIGRYPDVQFDGIEGRSEERRGGKGCVSPCRSRWWQYHLTTNNRRETYR